MQVCLCFVHATGCPLLRQKVAAHVSWASLQQNDLCLWLGQALRSKAESIRAAELDKTLSKFGEGMSKKQVCLTSSLH